MDLSDAVTTWQDDGFVVLRGYLDDQDFKTAQYDLSGIFPSAEEYHQDPDAEHHQPFHGSGFGGNFHFPFPTVALSRLVVHDKLLALAEAFLDTDDIRIYMGQLWAKYTGAASYEQEHHRDYVNHTPLVPSSEVRWRGLEMFIWMNDVPEDHGPTQVVPLPVTAGVPALPRSYDRSQRPDFYEAEQSAAGPAGTVLVYTTDTFHRGTEFKAPRAARYSLHINYRRADNPWTTRQGWGERSMQREWAPFVEQATPRQLELFDFPPPGHPYWTAETIEGIKVRYPGLDTSPWESQL
jgi:hypothetical protein